MGKQIPPLKKYCFTNFILRTKFRVIKRFIYIFFNFTLHAQSMKSLILKNKSRKMS